MFYMFLRPKFFRAEHSATTEGENCAYGPTLLFKIKVVLDLQFYIAAGYGVVTESDLIHPNVN